MPLPSPLLDFTAVGSAPALDELDPSGLVLLIEDDEMICKLMRTLLERRGLRVRSARSGTEALDFFAEHASEVALVVTDLRLPDMDGYDVCQQIRQADLETPILLCSGVSPKSDWSERVGGRGPVHFLAKPFSPMEFMRGLQLVGSPGLVRI